MTILGAPPRGGPGAGRVLNREALRLYRDILRACRLFDNPSPTGERWGDVLARSARQEFEAARNERDPELIARLLVVGNDALMQVQEKVRHRPASSRRARVLLKRQGFRALARQRTNDLRA